MLTHNNLSGKTLIDRLHKNLLTFYLPRENIIKDALILKVQEIVDKKHFKLLHEALIWTIWALTLLDFALLTIQADKSPMKNMKKLSIARSMMDAGNKNLQVTKLKGQDFEKKSLAEKDPQTRKLLVFKMKTDHLKGDA